MGFLKTDYANTGDFEPLPIGEYEAIVSAVEIVKTKETNKDMIKATLTVRDDVEQAGQKRKFFDNLVYQENMIWKFNQVAKACQFPEGQDVESINQFAEQMLYKCVKIKNKHRVYEGEKQDTIGAWKPSTDAGYAGSELGVGPAVDVNPDDLPF